jgi:peroxiredoxin
MNFKAVVLAAVATLTMSSASFAVKVGDAAPTFSVMGADGANHKLSDYKGKFVVLEWHNKDCPFVRKHYQTGNMQKLQKKWTAKNVTWLAVISSAPGKEGFATASDAQADMTSNHAAVTTTLLDSKGKVGKAFGAKTTPQMVVINPDGKVIYDGAIDDKPTPDKADVTVAKNYVDAALEEATSGRAVSTPATTPYGCSVKYN